jgi:phosphate/sulfate permease
MYTYAQLITAAAGSVVHGGQTVMNAISPLIAIVTLTKTDTIASTSSVSGSDTLWIRTIGVSFHLVLVFYQLAIHSAYDSTCCIGRKKRMCC